MAKLKSEVSLISKVYQVGCNIFVFVLASECLYF